PQVRQIAGSNLVRCKRPQGRGQEPERPSSRTFFQIISTVYPHPLCQIYIHHPFLSHPRPFCQINIPVHLRIHQPVFSYPRQLLPSPRRISWRCYTPSTQRNRPCSSSYRHFYQYFSWYFYPVKARPATPLQPPQILVMAMSRRSLLLSIHLLSVSSSRTSVCLSAF